MFHWVNGGFNQFRLDIVGFLAILGEGSVEANGQVATLSKLVFLPRLVPAPHAYLKTSRPDELEPTNAGVAGVSSGNYRHHLNHIAHVLLNGDSMQKHEVRCVEITKIPDAPEVKAKTRGPLTVVLLLGCAFSIALLALSITQEDGMSLLATLLLSLLSSVVGLGNKWKLQLVSKKPSDAAPPGDVVIRYPKGSFHVVKCNEEVARELYFAPEEIQYLISDPRAYRILSLVGTMLLMFGVIALSNATTPLQIAWAASYILLNAAYWVVAALPAQMHWELSSFEVKEQFLEAHPRADTTGEKKTSFTKALWKAILFTKSTEWIPLGNTAPRTDAWNCWIRDAEEAALSTDSHDEYKDPKRGKVKIYKVPNWDPQAALEKHLKESRVQKLA
ncbi:MAG: hypothetical protein M1820_004145 [Bogoriella megaspora]|nr:MAG: hypothetical protein M1820_004145 [Bogoriella megaspora]